MTYTFALDTTSKESSISILLNNQTLAEYNFTPADSLSSSLFPAIDFVFKHSGLNPEKIDVFGIAIGPGLFTGIRVGLVALKGLLLHLKKPVVPVITLKALADKCDCSEGTVIPIIDAKKDEVYMACYHYVNQTGKEIFAPLLLPVKKIKDKLKGFKKLCFTGRGAEVHKEKLKEMQITNSFCVSSNYLATEIGKITHEKYLKGNYITDLHKLRPIYIRKPDVKPNYIKKGEKT